MGTIRFAIAVFTVLFGMALSAGPVAAGSCPGGPHPAAIDQLWETAVEVPTEKGKVAANGGCCITGPNCAPSLTVSIFSPRMIGAGARAMGLAASVPVGFGDAAIDEPPRK